MMLFMLEKHWFWVSICFTFGPILAKSLRWEDPNQEGCLAINDGPKGRSLAACGPWLPGYRIILLMEEIRRSPVEVGLPKGYLYIVT